MKQKEVIILNKPFLGNWLDNPENIGHEIIDFLSTDNGELYIYNNPYGQCPDNIWVGETDRTTNLKKRKSEKYYAKYLILCSGEHNNSFDILYIIELQEKLHREHTTKHNKNIPEDEKLQLKSRQEKIKKIIDKNNIVYNGKKLYEIYKNDNSLYVTFKASKIYKAINPIPVNDLKDYKFQRNKGYLYSDNEKGNLRDDFKTINDIITNAISSLGSENSLLEEFIPSSVSKKSINSANASNTFINLIMEENNEQIFTNILFNLLKDGNLFNDFCNEFKGSKTFCLKENFNVFREAKVVGGRTDICANSESQRVVIENKINSGLNGLKPSNNSSQLSQYYAWAKDGKTIEPLCFIVLPDSRRTEIIKEIERKDPSMKDIYNIIGYGEIADFVETKNKHKKMDGYLYKSLLPQIIQAFKNLSKTTQADLYARLFLEATEIYK